MDYLGAMCPDSSESGQKVKSAKVCNLVVVNVRVFFFSQGTQAFYSTNPQNVHEYYLPPLQEKILFMEGNSNKAFFCDLGRTGAVWGSCAACSYVLCLVPVRSCSSVMVVPYTWPF